MTAPGAVVSPLAEPLRLARKASLFRMWRVPKSLAITLILLFATVALRLPWLGDALYHEDEGFYLAFAKAMHQGALPYVDVWDRKPFGLFILYWLVTFLPVDPVLAYQAVSGLFAFGTAWAIYRVARYSHGEAAACGAAILYLAYLLPLFGGGGQAPVFYNLFVSFAVLALMPLQGASVPAAFVFRRGCIATLLCGLALTVKPTVVVESVFLGLVAATHLVRRTDIIWHRRMLGVAVFALLGLLPTLFILAGFAAIGEFQSYWFATVQSLALKMPQPLSASLNAARYLGLILLPFWLMASLGAIMAFRGSRPAPVTRFLAGWGVAAIGGFLLIPSFWDHYAISLLPPFAIFTAWIIARARTGIVWAFLSVGWAMAIAGWPTLPPAKATPMLDNLVQTINRERRGGCLYVYEGPAVLYALTNACRVTSRLFPQHLDLRLERDATGIDPDVEMHGILARGPAVIVLTSRPIVREPNVQTRAILLAGLHRGYWRVGVFPMIDTQSRSYDVEVWRRQSDRQRR